MSLLPSRTRTLYGRCPDATCGMVYRWRAPLRPASGMSRELASARCAGAGCMKPLRRCQPRVYLDAPDHKQSGVPVFVARLY